MCPIRFNFLKRNIYHIVQPCTVTLEGLIKYLIKSQSCGYQGKAFYRAAVNFHSPDPRKHTSSVIVSTRPRRVQFPAI